MGSSTSRQTSYDTCSNYIQCYSKVRFGQIQQFQIQNIKSQNIQCKVRSLTDNTEWTAVKISENLFEWHAEFIGQLEVRLDGIKDSNLVFKVIDNKHDYDTINPSQCPVLYSKNLDYPINAVMDKSNRDLIVSDYDNNRLQVFNNDTIKYIGQGELKSPIGICTHEDNQVFVCDLENKRLKLFDLEQGNLKRCLAVESHPRCISISPTQDQMAISLRSNAVAIYSMYGEIISDISLFDSPMGVSFNSRGDLLVGDSKNRRIVVLNGKDYEYLGEFGKFSGDWLHISIDSFDQIIVCDTELLYFFDQGFQNINTCHLRNTKYARGVYCDELNQRLLICDSGHHCVRYLSLKG